MAIQTKTGAIDQILSGVDAEFPSIGASEGSVLREMQKNGMETSSSSGASPVQSFSNMLEKSIEKVNQSQVEADQSIKELVAGKSKNIHETLLAVERADSSLKLMMQVRNKILDAYKEIMRMQV